MAEKYLENEDDRIIFSLKLNRNKSIFFHSYVEEKIKEIIDEKMYFDVTKNYKYLNDINIYNLVKNSNICKYLNSSDMVKLYNIITSNRKISFFEREQAFSLKKIHSFSYMETTKFNFYINKKNNLYACINGFLALDISSFQKDENYIKIVNRSVKTITDSIELESYEKVFNNDYQNFINNIDADKLLKYSLKSFEEIRKNGKYNIDLSNFLIVSLFDTLKSKIKLTKEEYET